MKKRIRSHPSNPYYSTEPAVASGMIAGKPPVQSASLGNQTPKMVPKHPGRSSGLAGFVDKHKPPMKKATGVPSNKLPGKSKVPSQGHLRKGGIGKKLKGL